MKILVISGFLGAGKTTFIKTMSEKLGRDFCVLENEYAQVDIDKAILLENSNMNIWELTENCICCSGKQDFANSILTISNVIDPEYLIVEPTGVAKLSSILSNIQRIEYERISLLKPITMIDGNRMHSQKKEFADIYIDQIQNSELVIITKCENKDADELQMIQKEVHQINPNAEVVIEHYNKQNEMWWNTLLDRSINGTLELMENDEKETSLEKINLTNIEIPSIVHLISFLEMVVLGIYGKVCRAKGYLRCGAEWIRFDIVDGVYSVTGIVEQEEARGVFIGENLNRSALRRIMTPYLKRYNSSNAKLMRYKNS